MKKIMLLLIIGCLLLSQYGMAASAAELSPSAVPGDMNFDGEISAPDALAALRLAVIKWCPLPPAEDATLQELQAWYDYHAAFALADVNNDTRVSAQDALLILQYAVGTQESFPLTDITQSVLYGRLPAWPGDAE